MPNIKEISNLNFQEFNAVDAETWKKKIELDLKGKDWESFFWEIEPGLMIDPAQVDWQNDYTPLYERAQPIWIGQELTVGNDLEIVNKQLLGLLMKGVSAPNIYIDRILSTQEWELLFNQVELEYLHPTFRFSDLKIVKQCFTNFSQTKNHTGAFKGCLLIEGASPTDKLELGKDFKEKTRWALRGLNFKIDQGVNTQKMSEVFNAWLAAKESFASKEDWIKATNFEITLGDNFLKAIGKLRAIHALINLICAELKLNPSDAFITAKVDAASLNDESELALIQLSNISIAANLGGAHQIDYPILDPDKANFYQRITSNIQHILTLESNLDKVHDPLAGSHFVEALTETIASTVWEKMKG